MKGLSKRSKEAICYLCGDDGKLSDGLTRDHVFPEGLFVGPKPVNLLTLPCCKKCQQEYDLHEEYFRNVIAGSGKARQNVSIGEQLWEKVSSSVKRTPAMHRAVLQSIVKVDVQSPAGIYLGTSPAISIDRKRVDQVIRKIACGLHYHHTHSRVTKQHTVNVFFEPIPFDEYMQYANHGRDFGEVVSYRGGTVKGSNSSIWWIIFYKAHRFSAVVMENEATGHDIKKI